MGELVSMGPQDTLKFLDNIGFNHQGLKIVKTFPSYFKDRRVIHVTGNQGTLGKVWKLRPNNEDSYREQCHLQKLWSSYRFSGSKFPCLQVANFPSLNYVGFEMEYLGIDLKDIASDLDLIDLGQLDPSESICHGFSCDQINSLVSNLISGHMAFARQYGLFHGDLYQNGANNIVYHPSLRKLFLVDAEALNSSEEAEFRFNDQIEKVREWMYRNLTV